MALGLAAFALSACGNSSDGAYIADQDGDLATITIDGTKLTYTETDCDGSVDEDETSAGEINDSQTVIIWTQEGRWSGDDQITLSDGALVISSDEGDPDDDDNTFVKEDSDAGKALTAEFEADCAG